MPRSILLPTLAAAALACGRPAVAAASPGGERLGPAHARQVEAVTVFDWRPGALYQVFGAPGRVTDIALEPGERLVGAGPVAAGDTARWILGEAESGTGDGRRAHVLVKPVAEGLATNLVINTDRRTYHVELKSTAAAYMAAVSWRYPAGELIALRKASGQEQAAPAPLDAAGLSFGYRIEGKAPWRPVRVFDDGRRTYVDFPDSVAQGEMPPLFLRGPDGGLEPASVRVRGRRMILDRLFDAAELRIGVGRQVRSVLIVREPVAR